MATKTKRTTTARNRTGTASAGRTTTKTNSGGSKSTTRRLPATQMNKGKGAAGASAPPKPVSRPSGGTKMGGGKPAGTKGGRGC